jgi:signal transduction histidine kinase/CheY-like chemotaxis protein
MTSAPMLNALLKDPIVRIAIALWAAAVALLLVPILPPDWVNFYSEHILDAPFQVLVIAAVWFQIRSVDDEAERRFWKLIGLNAICSLVIALAYLLLQSTGHWTMGWKIFSDIGYLGGYVAMLLAIEVRPHGRPSGPLSGRERQLRTFGFVVLITFVLAYFIIVPAASDASVYEATSPAFYLFLCMDVVILWRVLAGRADAWSVRWSWVYSWLAVALSILLLGDVVEFATFHSSFTLPPGTWLDLLWMTPPTLIAIAVRARHVSFPAEQRVLNEPVPGRSAFRVGHMLLIGAVALPGMHEILQMTHQLDPATIDAREMVSLFGMWSMAALALDAYRALDKDRDKMERQELHLASELGVTRKMDAVARLAASVAHDFNNLIHIVQGRTDVIADQLPDDDPLQEEIREISAANARAADLASQLMAFGRTQPTSPATVSLHDLVRRAERLLKPLLDERSLLRLRLDATDEVVRIDPLQFERVILNLVTNARDAMPGGGTITIETFNPGLDNLVGEPYTDPSIVRIAVSDTGAGMERTTMAHIFEPFFTTKEGRGAGLGLAITHGLVQQAGGTITVDSELGKGTTFHITLPVVRGTEPESIDIRKVTATPGAVLIIEMDATNRQLLRRLLVDLERPVLTAATGPEALLVATRYPGPIDLSVVDVTCEGGRTVTAQLRELMPGMRGLLLAQDQPVEPSELDVLLREPFELADVLRAARRLVFATPETPISTRS